jgi:hypothetical protein
MELPEYKYATLDADSIRVFVLRPLNDGVELQGCVISTRLGADMFYEAISYCWATESGDDSLLESLRIGQRSEAAQIPITKTCRDALCRFRNAHRPRVLWVDAICIDQTNQHECSHQVGIMAEIYRRAEKVLIYLGSGVDLGVKSSERIERLFAWIKRWACNAKGSECEKKC